MIRWILEKLGWTVGYRDDRGLWSHRYDSTDFAMERPIHRHMSVALPGARMEIRR